MKKTKKKKKSELLVKFAKGSIKVSVRSVAEIEIEKRRGNKFFIKRILKNFFHIPEKVFTIEKKLNNIKPKAKKRRGKNRG